MKKIIFYLLFAALLANCTTTSGIKDLRQFPTYRLGLVQVGWMDPNWRIDVWVNAQPFNPPSFTLLPGWQKELEVESDDVSIYVEAWIWDRGQKLVVAKTKEPMRVKISKARDWDGYGWRVILWGGDFVTLRQTFF